MAEAKYVKNFRYSEKSKKFFSKRALPASVPPAPLDKVQMDTIVIYALTPSTLFRGGASPEKVGWKRDRIDGQKVYLTIFMSFLLRNEYLLEESGVDMSTPVHPVVPPLPLVEQLQGFSSELIRFSERREMSRSSSVISLGKKRNYDMLSRLG